MLVPILLNWYTNPYHMPIILAKALGYYKEEGLDICLLEPDNPSEVTRLIGQGHIPIGLKAMVHCFAARARGHQVTSIGTLFDEPPTGLITREQDNIRSITDIVGKRIGFVGEFGKIMIDQLAHEANVEPGSYETVRIGMYAAEALSEGRVDAAIGLSCFQQIQAEEAGIRTHLLRIKEEIYSAAKQFKKMLRGEILLIINDHIDIALALADGVHIGQSDMPLAQARQLTGADFTIGVSTHNIHEARLAEAEGASYISIGCLFTSPTKHDTIPATYTDEFNYLSTPLCGIGGINTDNIHLLKGKVDMFAVCSALWGKPDPIVEIKLLNNYLEN